MYWVGFDVGGTFVDIFAFDTRTATIHALKHRSSRQQPAAQVYEGLSRLLSEIQLDPAEVERLAHGTTLVTNILVERSGAKVGMIVTRGFRDVLEIGRMRRPSLYDLYRDKPAPLAPRDAIVEVNERIVGDGNVLQPLDEAELRTAIDRLKDMGVETVAVCFLHAYANPVHEEIAARIIEEAGLPVSPSSRVSAEYGEFERFATAVVNSYSMPAVRDYVGNLTESVQILGIPTSLQIMQSNGGVIPVDIAKRFPVRLASSGPTAGVMGAALLARQIGRGNLITLDMGGTSTDVSLVVGGEAAYISEHDLAGFPIRSIGVDIRSIGAGGGSIARLDRTGALRVGPESAGAEPGPACYGWGGTQPTVSDADLVLGFLSPDRFCGGRIALNSDLARTALVEAVANPRGVSADEAALGVVRICVTNMVGAVRNITMERGYDPRDFSLVAFGGAGPAHAALVAAELNIPEVIVLRDPGLLSAKGLLLTNYRSDMYRTCVQVLEEVNPATLSALFEELENEALLQLPAADHTAGFRVRRILEMCYEGQENMVPVELSAFPLQREHLPSLAEQLNSKFKAIFGFVPTGRRPQILHARLFAEALVDTATLLGSGGLSPLEASAPTPGSQRPVLFPGHGSGRIDTPIYERRTLAPGASFSGPAIVEEEYSTTVILPAQRALVDAHGNLIIRAEDTLR
jgi:N-methylhydantoinase A